MLCWHFESVGNGRQHCLQDDLLAELEELEQEELESDLLEVGEPSKALDLGDPIDELPEVRKCSNDTECL